MVIPRKSACSSIFTLKRNLQIKLLVFSHPTFEKEPFLHVVLKKILVKRLNNGQSELPEF